MEGFIANREQGVPAIEPLRRSSYCSVSWKPNVSAVMKQSGAELPLLQTGRRSASPQKTSQLLEELYHI